MLRSEEQEGLEVVDVADDVDIRSGLEPVNDLNGPHPESSDTFLGDGGNYDTTDANEKIAVDENREPRKSRKRRRLWIIAAVVAIIVIVGAVVGGVLGSKASKSSHDSKSDSNTASSTKIRGSSPLAVTGWRLGGKTNIQLFWQGKDDFVYYSAWSSGNNSWDNAVKLSIGAIPGTPMAVGVIYQPTQASGLPNAQVEFFYQNTSGYLNGENFQSSFAHGLPDSINNNGLSFKMTDGSALSAYWPLIIYESPGLEAVWYGPNETGYISQPESLSALSAIGSVNTPTAVLPLQQMHPSRNHTVESDMKLLYRRDDGHLYELDRWSNGTVTMNDQLKGFEIPSNGTLAAFTNAQDKTTDYLNTYLIYQAADGKIMYGTNTNSSGWLGPNTDVVFDGADIPTNLACVTAAAGTGPNIPLTSATDLNKCYFQSGGRLVEVMYDGTTWSKLGTIPTL